MKKKPSIARRERRREQRPQCHAEESDIESRSKGVGGGGSRSGRAHGQESTLIFLADTYSF